MPHRARSARLECSSREDPCTPIRLRWVIDTPGKPSVALVPQSRSHIKSLTSLAIVFQGIGHCSLFMFIFQEQTRESISEATTVSFSVQDVRQWLSNLLQTSAVSAYHFVPKILMSGCGHVNCWRC